MATHCATGARSWLAHTGYNFAAMLVARGSPGDRERAQALVSEARALAESLGMARLTAQLLALQATMTSDSILT
jgi:hypothetical protein